jgi:hypothetical protein
MIRLSPIKATGHSGALLGGRLGETRIPVSAGFFLLSMALAWRNDPPMLAHEF